MSIKATIQRVTRSVTFARRGVTVVDNPYKGLTARTTSTSQTWAATATTVELTTGGLGDTGLSLASNEVTVTAAGRIEADALVELSVARGDQAIRADVWLELSGSEVAGTRRSVQLDDFVGPERVEIKLHAAVTAGQTLRIRSQRTIGVSEVVLVRAALSVEVKTQD